jgi:PAS domain S-box-containing protein
MPEDQRRPQRFEALWQCVEEILQPNSGQPGSISLEDAWQALRDLQVYQGELERQNEGLRCTQAEVEAARDRYAALYDFAPVGYFTLDEAGHIQEANLKGAAMLGAERELLAGQLLSDFVAREDRDAYNTYLKELFQAREAQARICDLRMLRRDGSGFYARLEGEAGGAEAGRQCRLAVSESENRFRTIYDTAPVSIWQEDWTSVIEALEQLRSQGVADFPAYFQDHPGFVTHMLQAVKILDVNQWTLDIFGARHKEELLATLDTVFATPDTLPGFVAELTALAEG